VDLRNAGFKLAPVDTNLFPGGFNNLRRKCCRWRCRPPWRPSRNLPGRAQPAADPGNPPGNTFYLQNVGRLMQIFRQTGLNVRLGTLSPGSPSRTDRAARRHPAGGGAAGALANGRRLGLKDFDPCTILLNNDLSAGIPVLENCTSKAAAAAARRLGAAPQEQPLRRLRRGGEEVRQADRVDPWMLNPLFAKVATSTSRSAPAPTRWPTACRAAGEDRKKYKEYGIKEQPFVIVKADAGTYGMGIMTVKDASEIKDLNRKQRTR
jgi:glutamate--cysteine ligase